MRIAVISDIHGNRVALDAVCADWAADPPDQVVCLGDAIQGGAQPAETVARLRALACPVVMGNADAWLLTGQVTGTSEPVSAVQEAVRAWSLAQLSVADRAFIAAFPPTVEIALDGGQRLVGFHGSPQSFDELIFPETPEAELESLLGRYRGAVLTGGHTHLQQIRRFGDAFFFNPGSVGLAYARHQPADHFRPDPWAEYALLTATAGHLRLEFRRVPFDVAAWCRVIRASGRPDAATVLAQYAPDAGPP
ncbi:MAG TPA: metallophosphoesterase family protein [Chloroflexia bacterium]|nr:metallophosphoesterase family protein [Chloroflexia bacterium]